MTGSTPSTGTSPDSEFPGGTYAHERGPCNARRNHSFKLMARVTVPAAARDVNRRADVIRPGCAVSLIRVRECRLSSADSEDSNLAALSDGFPGLGARFGSGIKRRGEAAHSSASSVRVRLTLTGRLPVDPVSIVHSHHVRLGESGRKTRMTRIACRRSCTE